MLSQILVCKYNNFPTYLVMYLVIFRGNEICHVTEVANVYAAIFDSYRLSLI